MKQDLILIGNVIVPVIIDKEEVYYPISYITTNVLLRTNKNGLINKTNKNKYKKYIKQYDIDFGIYGIQKTNCISKEGLIEVLNKTEQSRLTVEQRKSQNELHKHLGLPLLTEREWVINKLSKEFLNEHDDYTQDIIKHEIKHNPDIKFQLCSHCLKYYPLSNIFFRPDQRRPLGFTSVCNVCDKRTTVFKHYNHDLYYLRKREKELYNAMKEGYVIPVYEAYLKGEIKRLPDSFQNKETLLQIVKYLYDKGDLTIHNLTIKTLKNKFGLNSISAYLSTHDIYTYLFGEDYYYYPWKYPKFSFREIKLTYEIANKVFDNYLKEHGIKINDPLNFDYEEIIKKSRISKFVLKDLLYFAVQYNQFKYAGYQYKIASVNYYKNETNLLFDLKYLIEQDMKIPVDKIPLYLTKNVLQKRARPLYNYIVLNKNGSIYKWVNKLYPNKFIETDFEINAYRNEFDSDTECFIHELLVDKFKNKVIYNQKHTDRTIVLDGMIPDWFVMTEKGVWIVEYFGMYTPDRCYNTRVKEYIEKTNEKINKYKNMKGYNFVFLYPEDIDDNFKGCREKIEKIGK
jgi:hypothetical protein